MPFHDTTPEISAHYDSLAGAKVGDLTKGINDLDRRGNEIAYVAPDFAQDVETIIEQAVEDPRLLAVAHQALDDICEVLAA